MPTTAKPHKNQRLGSQSVAGHPLFGNNPKAQEIDLRIGFIPEDAEDEKVQL